MYWTVVVGLFWPWSRSTARPAFWLVSSCVAERVEDARAELDRVGAAQLLDAGSRSGTGRGGRHWSLHGLGLSGVTVICGVMLSDQLTSVPVVDRTVLVSCSVQVPLAFERRSGSTARPMGLIRPGEGGCAAGDRRLRRVVEDGVGEVRAARATSENSGTWRPVRRDQDGAESSDIARGRDVELDREVGDLERAVVVRNGQRRVERAGRRSESRRGSSGRRCSRGKYCGPRSSRSGP